MFIHRSFTMTIGHTHALVPRSIQPTLYRNKRKVSLLLHSRPLYKPLTPIGESRPAWTSRASPTNWTEKKKLKDRRYEHSNFLEQGRKLNARVEIKAREKGRKRGRERICEGMACSRYPDRFWSLIESQSRTDAPPGFVGFNDFPRIFTRARIELRALAFISYSSFAGIFFSLSLSLARAHTAV